MAGQRQQNRGKETGRRKGQRQERRSNAPKADSLNWIWGIHPVLELLRLAPKQLLEINIAAGKSNEKIAAIEELAEEKRIPLKRPKKLTNQSAPSHQGVEAKIKPISFLSFNELLHKTAKIETPLILALDSIQDPHNLGAIIRSASAAGVDAIILPKDRSAPMSGTVAKTAVGATAMITLCQVTNLADTLKQLKKENFWIYGADGSAETDIYQNDMGGSVCLVIGSEGKGIRPLVRKQCDHLVKIPMHSALDSLNASVAAGVILFEIIRQRKAV